MYLQDFVKSDWAGCHILRAIRQEFKLHRNVRPYDFRMRRKPLQQRARSYVQPIQSRRFSVAWL
jgi:hypothetical protein